MTEQWQELKEIITEMRDNDGTATQQEVCKFLVNYMDVLEKQMQEPCEDAISRQAVLDVVNNPLNIRLDEIIKQLPSVKPQELKTGHWEWVQYDSNPNIGNWHCSECRTIIPHMPVETDNTPIYKWCPMCGAKMIEPQEREVQK